MKALHWLYSKHGFAELVIDKAPNVLFVIVTVTFLLFLLLMVAT
jgi:hypothetical protein